MLKRVNRRLEAGLAVAASSDFYWGTAAPETSQASLRDLLVESEVPCDEVLQVGMARNLPGGWAAWRCLTVDDHGDPDETETVLFQFEGTARDCWEESLAAARAKKAVRA